MANKAIDALVYCPFYKCESVKSITCEGLISPHAVNKFDTEEAKKQHEFIFCVSKECRHCPAHKALIQKYDGSVMRH